MIVVSDTGPINYLVLVESIDLLPTPFGRVVVPKAVEIELQRQGTPLAVREWLSRAPDWLEVRSAASATTELRLGAGEREAIALALELNAELLLIDDRRGRRAAEGLGVSVAGTVTVLELGAQRGLIDLPEIVRRLRSTNFHISDAILERVLQADAERCKEPPDPSGAP